jgi:hypothetical protein
MTRLFCLLLVLAACDATSVTLSQNCDVRIATLNPSTSQPGEIVAAEGGPMTQVWDTAVYVDGARAEVVGLERQGCEACDACKEENQCKACDDCDDCDALCDADCTEVVQFVAPDNEEGTVQVSLFNGHGQSNSVPLLMTSNSDTGLDSGDTSDTDTASPVDSGVIESTDTADDLPTDTDG